MSPSAPFRPSHHHLAHHARARSLCGPLVAPPRHPDTLKPSLVVTPHVMSTHFEPDFWLRMFGKQKSSDFWVNLQFLKFEICTIPSVSSHSLSRMIFMVSSIGRKPLDINFHLTGPGGAGHYYCFLKGTRSAWLHHTFAILTTASCAGAGGAGCGCRADQRRPAEQADQPSLSH